MTIGFIPDDNGLGNAMHYWIDGAPEKDWLGSLVSKGRKVFPVGTFRCGECGYLELYARDEFSAKKTSTAAPHHDDRS